MKTFTKTALLVCFAMALALPDAALARAGGGRSSMGSMGGRTYSAPSYSARPIQRSITPQAAPRPAAPSMAPLSQPQPAVAPMGFAGRHPFLTSIAGGFMGAGLANMLFGHSGMDMGAGGMGGGSGLGGLLQLVLLGGLIFFAFRWFRQRTGGSGPNLFKNLGDGNVLPFGTPSAGQDFGTAPQEVPSDAPLLITAEDTQAFQQLLEKIQLAWGTADLARLRQFVTPEMLQYFSEELSANTSRGEMNRVTEVTVQQCAQLEAWSEASLDYATVNLKWTAIDFMARMDRQRSDSDFVASGDAAHPAEAQEIWTFARARDGGHWLLSAIQQVA